MSFDKASSLALFKRVGIADKQSEDLCKVPEKGSLMLQLISSAGGDSSVDKTKSVLLYDLCMKYFSLNSPTATDKSNALEIAKLVGGGKIDKIRLPEALKLFAKNPGVALDLSELHRECGVGVVVSPKDVEACIQRLLEKNQATLKSERYRFPLQSVLIPAKEELKWVEGKDLKDELDKHMLSLLGPKTAEDLAPPVKKADSQANAKVAQKKGGQITSADKSVSASLGLDLAALKLEGLPFPSPADNAAGNKIPILKKHLEQTGGKIITRFPPEPNGYLHIGHAKAMHLDFGFGTFGECIFRYDDTNPEAETGEYFDTLAEMVSWLGHKPSRTTYTSDYHQQLYDLAMKLVMTGKAYVCHQKKEEMSKGRRFEIPSPWRDTPIAENVKKFEDMRKGKYDEGEACLRMKIDMKHPNTVMRDPVAFRIKYHPHHRTENKWCVYASYDFSHCIVDSLENVTHSLCTLEFDVRRESYYWLLDALELYKPLVWEFSRLNLVDEVEEEDGKTYYYSVTLSKRKLLSMVKTKHARGWDDPRMPTLVGLRRRGFTPEAINQFCADIGVTRNTQKIPFRRLEQSLRMDLDGRGPRAFGMLHPLKITISNFDQIKGSLPTFKAPNHPHNAALGERALPFSSVIYIEQSDFREEDHDDYFGLAPNKEVGLRYAANIKCVSVVKKDGRVTELICTCDPEKKTKVKGHIHWVDQSAQKAEVRLYDWLYHTRMEKKAADKQEAKEAEEKEKAKAAAGSAESTAAEEEDEDQEDEGKSAAGANTVTSDMGKCPETVLRDCLVEASVTPKPLAFYQFERVGYFVVDFDSTPNRLVLNRSVSLKESKGKRELGGN